MRAGTEWDGMNNGCSFMVMVGGGIAAVGFTISPTVIHSEMYHGRGQPRTSKWSKIPGEFQDS